MTRNWMITPGADMLYKLAVYKKLTDGVIALQRAELQKVRLEIARERLELLREKRLSKSGSTSGSSTDRSSSPESVPENDSACRHSSFELRHSSASAEDGPPIPQNIAPPQPVPAPSTPVPGPCSDAHPTARRSNVPPNAPPGTVISINPLRIVQRPAVHPAP